MASSPEPISMLNQPLSSLREETFIKLCCNLTTASFGERSWKGLGGKIGLNAWQVDLLNKHQESDKGWLLLKTWENLDKSGATVKKLIVALESLQMRSCINVIRDDTSISGKYKFIISYCQIYMGGYCTACCQATEMLKLL